jgi:hypothetical protein
MSAIAALACGRAQARSTVAAAADDGDDGGVVGAAQRAVHGVQRFRVPALVLAARGGVHRRAMIVGEQRRRLRWHDDRAVAGETIRVTRRAR